MPMIDKTSRQPIYEQIVQSVEREIAAGLLQENEKLPSVRELAMQLSINPNTIQRAYAELESEGVIYSVAGKGSFAAPHHEAATARKEELFQQLDALAVELRDLGVTDEEIVARIKGGNKQ